MVLGGLGAAIFDLSLPVTVAVETSIIAAVGSYNYLKGNHPSLESQHVKVVYDSQ